MAGGRVDGIYLRERPEEDPASVEAAWAEAGRGLRGDRYYAGTGSFWREGRNGQEVTLIEAEALAALRSDSGIELPPEQSRRNVLTSGISLETLLGQRFRIGGVELVGVKRCPPCSRLEALTRPGVHEGLFGRGGLRADVIRSGELRVGDVVEPLGPSGGG